MNLYTPQSWGEALSYGPVGLYSYATADEEEVGWNEDALDDLANAPTEVLKEAIRELGETARMPGEQLEAAIEEAGDSRDALLQLMAEMIEEAGDAREDLHEAGTNLMWYLGAGLVTIGGVSVLAATVVATGAAGAGAVALGGGSLVSDLVEGFAKGKAA